jgi:predicted RNase H-like HicB family nuclease
MGPLELPNPPGLLDCVQNQVSHNDIGTTPGFHPTDLASVRSRSKGREVFGPGNRLERVRVRTYHIYVKYPVILVESEGGFAVSCPSLPGCWSQGKNREEALANIREAIRLWLEVAEEDALREAKSEAGSLVEVTV